MSLHLQWIELQEKNKPTGKPFSFHYQYNSAIDRTSGKLFFPLQYNSVTKKDQNNSVSELLTQNMEEK